MSGTSRMMLSAPLNGALVPSVMAANNLTYDGLDGHRAVMDPPLLVNANALGLAMRATVPHSWLDYAPGRTSHLQIGGNDILTGYMSGCLIARGTHLGVMSAFHVGTIVGNPGSTRQSNRIFLQTCRQMQQGSILRVPGHTARLQLYRRTSEVVELQRPIFLLW